MEDALREAAEKQGIFADGVVLILVLMEDALRVLKSVIFPNEYGGVLILVLMEDALRASYWEYAGGR